MYFIDGAHSFPNPEGVIALVFCFSLVLKGWMGAFYYSISRSTCFSGRVLFAPVYLEFQSPNLKTFKGTPGIDSNQSIRQASPGPARQYRLSDSISWNRFLGSLQVYKFGLRLGDNDQQYYR
jgi:hypothetical protein